MPSYTPLHRTFLFGTLLLISGILASTAQAAGTASAPPATPAATIPGNALAAGASEDSFQACLARIPKNATTGQRMIAEQSCQRDEQDRKPFQTTGGR
jgi:hypothetical protein